MPDGSFERKEMDIGPALGEAQLATLSVGELARTANVCIGRTEFIEGFELLKQAQEKAGAEGQDLSSNDATDLGYALAAQGHVFYNYCVDTDGYEFGGYTPPPAKGLEGEGRIRFVQAGETFMYAIEKDPSNVRAYFGLGDMQLELGQRQEATETAEKIEAILENEPSSDTFASRLALVSIYGRMEDEGKVLGSYAKAIERSISVHPKLRQKMAYDLAARINRSKSSNPKELQEIMSACRRAIILGPTDLTYQVLLSHVEKIQAAQEQVA
ncbi:MAG TPA: tetratricopeptide repeat protein [Candidatus Saccharimonadales bacterium]|nr:tetratricopeptide repeat protein [Candidatus Saccharimonadales bacterium]